MIQTSLYPRSQIDIFVQVIQPDRGLLQACINGTTPALMNAGIPMLDFVCAVSGGVHSTAPLLDLTLLEEVRVKGSVTTWRDRRTDLYPDWC